MDEKTTRIPSLKEFQESRDEKKLVQTRSRSMTSSYDRKKANAAFNRRDTQRVETRNTSAKTNRKTAQKTSSPQRRFVEEKKSPRSRAGDTQRIPVKQEQSVRRAPKREEFSQKSYPERERYRAEREERRRPAQPEARRVSAESREAQREERSRRSSKAVSAKKRKPASRRRKPKKPVSPFVRKVRRVMAYISLGLVIVVIGIVLSLTVLFKAENIVVSVPDGTYTEAEIVSASGLLKGENIFMANKSAASQRITEKYPYIKSADIYAVFPDTINIDITMATPAYAVKTSDVTYIADEDSKVLEVTATNDEVEVALIEGVEVKNTKVGRNLEFEDSIVTDTLGEMFSLAKENGYKKITKVNIESAKTVTGKETFEVKYVYDDRIVVFLGIPENISYKMATAQKIITDKIDVNNTVLTGELDVSMCYETKKSYFNQYSLMPEVIVPEETETQPVSTVVMEY